MVPAPLEVLSPLCRTEQVPAGQLLVSSGEEIGTIYLVQRGAVRLYVLQGAREITVAVHGAGTLLGGAALTDQEARWELYAEALGDLELCSIAAAELRGLCAEQPELLPPLLAILAGQLEESQERLGAQVFKEVSQRLAATLLDLAGEEGEQGLATIGGRISHQDLAHRVGSTRETITKLLGVFRDQGLLDLGYRRIAILDVPGLKAAAREPLR